MLILFCILGDDSNATIKAATRSGRSYGRRKDMERPMEGRAQAEDVSDPIKTDRRNG